MRICAASLLVVLVAGYGAAAGAASAKQAEPRVVTPAPEQAQGQKATPAATGEKAVPPASAAQNQPAPAEKAPAWWKDLGYGREQATPPAQAPGEAAPENPLGTEPAPGQSTVELALQAIKWLCILLLAFFALMLLVRRIGRKTKLLPQADLAEVIGRVYLAQRVVLHFVRTGGRVLVVGVNQNTINLIADLDAEAYDHLEAKAAAGSQPEERNREKAQRFFEELRAQQGTMNNDTGQSPPAGDEAQDVEIASLRGDIARLQRLLREASHDPNR